MSAAELAQAKLERPCRVCNKVGHWEDAHKTDGTLKPGTPSFDPSMISNGSTNRVKNSIRQSSTSEGSTSK